MYEIIIALTGGLACAMIHSRVRTFSTCPVCQIAMMCVGRIAAPVAIRRYSCSRCQGEFLRHGDGSLVTEADWNDGQRGDVPVARARSVRRLSRPA